MDKGKGSARARFQPIDILRGVAIVLMAVFHTAWDLYFFGFSSVDVTTDRAWVTFQMFILSLFLLLAGAGLVLAHGEHIRWPAFWRRFGIILVSALLVSLGTYLMFPDYWAYFGVLHAIALFSLLALPFLRAPLLLTPAVAVAVIVAAYLWSDPAMMVRHLAWIGFWPSFPPTTDIVPVFPWFGVLLLGTVGMRLLLRSRFAPLLSAYSDEPLARGLAWMGRRSLPVYLLHQPVIIGLVWCAYQLK